MPRIPGFTPRPQPELGPPGRKETILPGPPVTRASLIRDADRVFQQGDTKFAMELLNAAKKHPYQIQAAQAAQATQATQARQGMVPMNVRRAGGAYYSLQGFGGFSGNRRPGYLKGY